jgi:hypothetical protein
MAQELQTNVRVRSSATECLFLQHIMRNLAKGGRAGVVIPEGVLFRGGPDQKVRKELLEHFNVHTILSLPAGCFLPYTGVKTNVLFFDRPKAEPKAGQLATRDVWYYELTNDGFELKQTRKPIDGDQLPEFLKKWRKRTKGDNSWVVPIDVIIERGYDLSAKNPNRKTDYEDRPALELVQSLRVKEERIMDLLGELEAILEGDGLMNSTAHWKCKPLGDLLEVQNGFAFASKRFTKQAGMPLIRIRDLKNSQKTESWYDGPFDNDFVVTAGDLLVGMDGEFKCYRWNGGPALLNQRVCRLRGFSTEIMPEFVLYGINQHLRLIESNTPYVTVRHLSSKAIKAIQFTFPSLNEQQQIVSRIKECMGRVEEIIALRSEAVPEDSGLRESILRKAFAGEL